jgi:hypothetical protein
VSPSFAQVGDRRSGLGRLPIRLCCTSRGLEHLWSSLLHRSGSCCLVFGLWLGDRGLWAAPAVVGELDVYNVWSLTSELLGPLRPLRRSTSTSSEKDRLMVQATASIDHPDAESQIARWDAEVLAPWLTSLSARAARDGVRVTHEFRFFNGHIDCGLQGRWVVVRRADDTRGRIGQIASVTQGSLRNTGPAEGDLARGR